MTVTHEHTFTDLFCLRCKDLGIPDPTILEGTEHMVFRDDGGLYARCCMDCFERLQEELQD